eukprot:8799476-Ditylum_brightwellii.AAC.1
MFFPNHWASGTQSHTDLLTGVTSKALIAYTIRIQNKDGWHMLLNWWSIHKLALLSTWRDLPTFPCPWNKPQ